MDKITTLTLAHFFNFKTMARLYFMVKKRQIIKKSLSSNYEIEAGQSADFGYIVTCADALVPEDIELCSRRIDVKSRYEICD
ncbi:MAG: hypothetical protein NC120_13430 [Ruminococcus sp.]|nr:hypothetical protein [Ruminococcus sp.]